jgi:hypothetical protein
MCEIAITTSLHQEEYEIEISGTCTEFARVTKHLKALSGGVFALKHKPDTYYPVPMRHVLIEVV